MTYIALSAATLLPLLFDDQANCLGPVVWFRRTFMVPHLPYMAAPFSTIVSLTTICLRRMCPDAPQPQSYVATLAGSFLHYRRRGYIVLMS